MKKNNKYSTYSAYRVLSFIILLIISLQSAYSADLKTDIEKYLKGKNAEVGVAIIGMENGETITVNNDKHYPMQSVYKFHLALAVLAQVDKDQLWLKQKIKVTKKDLKPNTWSPMRDKYPKGNVKLNLAEIINFTVSQSDNNGCDILFKLIGGPKKVDAYIKNLGIKDISIKATEAQMHKSWNVQFSNWTTPLAAAKLLEMFYRRKTVSDSCTIYLNRIMENTVTGPMRLKGLLPENTVVAHKTGSSGHNAKGVSAATNDIGIVTLPNGKHYAIAVFVSNSTEPEETNERIIADICKMAWDWYLKK